MTFAGRTQIDFQDLPLNVEAEELANNEKNTIVRLLLETDNNKTEVAKRLKISRGKLYRKLEQYGIPH